MYGLKNVRSRHSDALSRVAWDQLESMLAIYYRGQGFRVEHVGTGAGPGRFDGGIDLKLFEGDEYIVVQCKHWNAKQVPHNDVHQLLGIMLNEGATGAILVSSGEFTAYARESAAKQGRVQLIDGAALREMLGPLPEPTGPAASLSPRASAVAAHVGERLLSAAEDRVRGYGRRPARRITTSRWAALAVLKLFLPLTVLAAVLVGAVALLNHEFGLLQPSDRPASNEGGQPSPVSTTRGPTSAVGAVSQTGVRQAPSAEPPVHHDRNSCLELIDHRSGTYIDHCAKAASSKPLSAAEQRELTRRANEAMRVIEASTPEM